MARFDKHPVPVSMWKYRLDAIHAGAMRLAASGMSTSTAVRESIKAMEMILADIARRTAEAREAEMEAERDEMEEPRGDGPIDAREQRQRLDALAARTDL